MALDPKNTAVPLSPPALPLWPGTCFLLLHKLLRKGGGKAISVIWDTSASRLRGGGAKWKQAICTLAIKFNWMWEKKKKLNIGLKPNQKMNQNNTF